MELWSHQEYAISEALQAIRAGEQRICICGPTGSGKTREMIEIIEQLVAMGFWVPIFTHRQMLVDMLRKELTAAGIPFGMRAAGYGTDPDQPVQVCMIQTERVRTVDRTGSTLWAPHGLKDGHERVCAVWDECHLMTSPTCREMMDLYVAHRGVNLGFSATPVNLWPAYTRLIEAGSVSGCRACGALVLAEMFAPDEPAMERIRGRTGTGIPLGTDLSEAEVVSAMMSPTIFGRVVQHWLRLNPQMLPTILFGPGKAESLWFAEQFAFPQMRAPEFQHYPAVSAAHIDGETVWCNGKSLRTSPEARRAVLEAHQAGEIKVLCNRFVMREGINMPWLRHGILATIFGSLKSYVQAGGRLLRADPASGKESVIVQDHGGNYWRHGSLNADRQWDLRATDGQISYQHAERFRSPPDGQLPPRQPFVCPQCTKVLTGKKCIRCGWELPAAGRRSRPVIEIDGSLTLRDADVFRPRRRMKDREKAARLWESYYWRAVKHSWNPTFIQLETTFAKENGWDYPPTDLPYMPRDRSDMLLKVRDVPREALIPSKEAVLA